MVFFHPFPEPGAFEDLHDSGEDVRGVHDDLGGSLRQRKSLPQQHTRGGRRAVHKRPAKLASIRGERRRHYYIIHAANRYY